MTNTTSYNTVNDLANAGEGSIQQYVAMSRDFAEKARNIKDNNPDSFMLKMSCQEVIEAAKKAQSADCDYTAYINAHKAEGWLGKMANMNF